MQTITLCIFLLVSYVVGYAPNYPAHPDRMSLDEVNTLLFRQNHYTTGRRFPGVPQLKCIGGDCSLNVDEVICNKVGGDSVNIVWNCKSTNNNIQFYDTDVVCEGYHDSSDPMILRGSCGLEYKVRMIKPKVQSGQVSYSFILFLVVLFLIIIAFALWDTTTTTIYHNPPAQGRPIGGQQNNPTVIVQERVIQDRPSSFWSDLFFYNWLFGSRSSTSGVHHHHHYPGGSTTMTNPTSSSSSSSSNWTLPSVNLGGGIAGGFAGTRRR